MFPCAVVHRSGKFAVIGDIYGQPGDSLHIELTGPKAGNWHDWANAGDRGRDLIGLFMATNNFTASDFPRALEIINSEFLGRVTPEWTRKFTIQFKERAESHAGKPRPQIDDRPPPTESYTYRDAAGGIIGVVRRHEHDEIDPETGKPKKTFSVWDARASRAQAPTPRPLYRLPEIIQHNEIVFTEGERKADALASVGIEATCIMFGSNAPLDKVDWTPLAGKKITIWPDKDASGMDFANRLAPYLANFKCQVAIITPPAEKPNKWDAADCLAEGGDAAGVIATATLSGAVHRPRVRLVNISDLGNEQPLSWLVQDVLTQFGLSMVWGRSGSLKSFVALDMGLCIATGLAWHGKPVKRGRVIYLAAEGSQGLTGRIAGWMQSRGKDQPPPDFQVVPHGLTLVNKDDMEALIAAINSRPERPVFIVVDTLARTFGSGNPNQPADMSAFVAACDRLREGTGAHVMVVHHGGKDTDKNELGNENLRNAADTVIHIRRKDDTIELINEAPKGKQKDAEEFPTISLRSVKIAYENKGKEQTTLILNLIDKEDLPKPKPDSEPQLGKIEKQIIAALTQARESLGLTRLALMTGAHNKSVLRALETLNEKGLVVRTDDGDGPKMWGLG